MLRMALIFLFCLPSVALAEESECRNGAFTIENHLFGLAKVVRPRIYFRGDDAPCPNESAACHGRSYVVQGDTLVTGDKRGSYICAFYPNHAGGSAGYVRQDEVASQPSVQSPPLSAWAGNWADGDDQIRLRPHGAGLTASGDAYWPSANPSLKDSPYGPNVGDMSGEAAPRGNAVTFAGKDPDDCRVDLTLLPPFLLARDNMNCGGQNVSFIGVYQRR